MKKKQYPNCQTCWWSVEIEIMYSPRISISMVSKPTKQDVMKCKAMGLKYCDDVHGKKECRKLFKQIDEVYGK